MLSALQLSLLEPPSLTGDSPGEAPRPAGRPELRDYQRRVVLDVARAWSRGQRRVLVVAATGSGKTVIAAELVRELVRRERRVLFVVHRDVLIDQTGEKFTSFGIPYGHIKSGYDEWRSALVQIASVQTLERRRWWYSRSYDHEEHAPVIVFDEAHITAFAAVSQKLLAAHREMRAVGLTATPWRLDPKESMADVFDACVCAPFPAELIEAGHLVPPRYYGTASPPDMRGVRTRAGDYVEEDVLLALDRPNLIQVIAAEWQQRCPGVRTLVFCAGVSHARHVAAHFAALGVPAASVDGTTPIPERNALYGRLRRGEVLVLASCAVLQEGFDVPEVGCVILSRPTKSRALFMQQMGRGLRIAPWAGKEACVVLDQAGNVGRFGFVEDLDHFDLHAGNGGTLEKGPPPRKECPECQQIVNRAVMVCPGCGYVWPVHIDTRPAAAPTALHELTRAPAVTVPEEERIALYQDRLRQALYWGNKLEQAGVLYKQRFGAWPKREWARGAVLGPEPTPDEILDYRTRLLEIAQAKGMDPGPGTEWAEKWVAAELGQRGGDGAW